MNTLKSYEEVLCDFVVKAKTQYCIEQIGIACASIDHFDQAFDWNTLLVTPPYDFGNSNSFIAPGPSSLQFVTNQYTQADKSLALKSEMVKDMLYASDFNSTCSEKIDVLVTEYEFWDNSCDPDGDTEDCPEETDLGTSCSCDVTAQWVFYQDLLNHAATVRTNSQATHPLLIDTYLGWFHADGTGNDQVQVDFIDNIVDRVYLHAYRSDPGLMLSYISSRMQLFGQNARANTIIRPIISNEHPVDEGNNFLGNWLDLINTPENTIYSAEPTLISGMQSSGSLGDNIVTEAAVTWFTYTYCKSSA